MFSDLNRIIINSKKKTVIEALSYVEFIVQSVRKKELYHSVQLSFEQIWNNLIWLDNANFAGVKGDLPSLENNSTNNENETPFKEIPTSLDIHFSLGSEIFLQNEFKIKFEEFATLLVQSLLEKQSATEAIRNNSHKICGLAIDLHKKYRVEDPIAVLKFVKLILKIIGINDLTEDIISLRRNLLKVIGSNEFSGDDELDTSYEFTLKGVTCKACNEYRDIELVNDKHQTMRNDG